MRLCRSRLVVLSTVSLLHIAPAVAQVSEVGGPETRRQAPEYRPKVEQHVVVPKDTFWSVTERVTGFGWFWPKVWSYNPQLTNPNWIYPGDVIRFAPGPAELASGDDETVSDDKNSEKQTERKEAPRIEVVDAVPPAQRGAPGARQVVVSAILTPKKLGEIGSVTNATADAILLTQGDVVYFKLKGKAAVAVGDKLLIYRTAREIEHPDSGKDIGYLTQITGTATAVSVDGKTVGARLNKIFAEIERGQMVAPFIDPVVNVTPKTLAKATEGTIVAVDDAERLLAGGNQFVFIDRGKKDGLEVGGVLTVTRRGDEFHSKYQKSDSRSGDFVLEIAKLIVVDANEKAATCLVTDSVREVEVGDSFRTPPVK